MIIYSFILFILITLIFILLLFNISYKEGINYNENKKKHKEKFYKKMESTPGIKEIMDQRNAKAINKSLNSFLTKKPSQEAADEIHKIKKLIK